MTASLNFQHSLHSQFLPSLGLDPESNQFKSATSVITNIVYQVRARRQAATRPNSFLLSQSEVEALKKDGRLGSAELLLVGRAKASLNQNAPKTKTPSFKATFLQICHEKIEKGLANDIVKAVYKFYAPKSPVPSGLADSDRNSDCAHSEPSDRNDHSPSRDPSPAACNQEAAAAAQLAENDMEQNSIHLDPSRIRITDGNGTASDEAIRPRPRPLHQAAPGQSEGPSLANQEASPPSAAAASTDSCSSKSQKDLRKIALLLGVVALVKKQEK